MLRCNIAVLHWAVGLTEKLMPSCTSTGRGSFRIVAWGSVSSVRNRELSGRGTVLTMKRFCRLSRAVCTLQDALRPLVDEGSMTTMTPLVCTRQHHDICFHLFCQGNAVNRLRVT